jgi:hypothetical protein
VQVYEQEVVRNVRKSIKNYIEKEVEVPVE